MKLIKYIFVICGTVLSLQVQCIVNESQQYSYQPKHNSYNKYNYTGSNTHDMNNSMHHSDDQMHNNTSEDYGNASMIPSYDNSGTYDSDTDSAMDSQMNNKTSTSTNNKTGNSTDATNSATTPMSSR